MPQRVISEAEFNTIRDHVLKTLPDNLSEADFNRAVGPLMAAAIGEAENSPKPVEGSALGRFVSNAWDTINPLNLVKAGASLVTHPVDTVVGMAKAQVSEAKKAYEKVQEPGLGSKVEAFGHGLAAVTPILGPIAAQAGEQIAEGDIAGGVGKGAGLLAPLAVGAVVRARTAPNARGADMLTRAAEEQVAGRVLAPGNPAFRGRAAAIAPEMLARKLSGGRAELQQAAEEGMADAASRIDDATQAAGGTHAQVSVLPVIARLQQRIKDLSDSNGVPLSDAAARRITALRDRQTHLRSLGKTGAASFEDLRKLRDESYRIADEARGYERQGNPSMSDEGWAAREMGSAIRQTFADRSPAAAMANADYTFWKTLNDVLDPVIGRPKATAPTQGVTGGARTVGAVTGQLVGGKAGAFIGSTVIPWLKERVASPQWQLADAQQKMKLAAAMRRGDIGTMKATMLWIEKAAAATSRSDNQEMPAPAVR